MKRREFLRGGSAVGLVAASGCTAILETESEQRVPPVIEDRPDSVYVPTHVEGMNWIGTTAVGDYEIGLMYSYPHRFWTVTGTSTEKVSIRETDDVHLMASVWSSETETVLPIASGLTVTIERDGESVAQKAPWPMISQNMGFHYGDNFALEGDGSYTVTVDISRPTIRRLGGFEDRFDDSESGTIAFDYSREERDALRYEILEDEQGAAGAVDRMEMEPLPTPVSSDPGALPGTHIADETSGDAVFQAIAVTDPQFFSEAGTYLAVVPRTPYNQVSLPMMSLSGTVERDGAIVFDDAFTKAIHPELGYHYGIFLDEFESDTTVTLNVESPPQVSRHEGYETAFLEMPSLEFSGS